MLNVICSSQQSSKKLQNGTKPDCGFDGVYLHLPEPQNAMCHCTGSVYINQTSPNLGSDTGVFSTCTKELRFHSIAAITLLAVVRKKKTSSSKVEIKSPKIMRTVKKGPLIIYNDSINISISIRFKLA